MLLTGSPGVGKTTVLAATVEALAKRGFRVGGMISREVRESGVRIGFEMLDLRSSKRGWLAQAGQKGGPGVGKYCVNLKDLEAIGAVSIIKAVEDCDVVAVDEIGPMELFSRKFREAANMAVQSRKLVLAVVHWKVMDRLVVEVKARIDSEIFVVTYQNREKLSEVLLSRAIEYLEQL